MVNLRARVLGRIVTGCRLARARLLVAAVVNARARVLGPIVMAAGASLFAQAVAMSLVCCLQSTGR